MNTCSLIGRLGQNPELRYTQNGKPVCKLNLAVDRRSSGQEKVTDWFTVVVWDKLAETCNEHLTKGREVGVTGRLQVNTWTAQDGSTRKNVEIVASDVKFLGAKPDDGNSQGGGRAPARQQGGRQQQGGRPQQSGRRAAQQTFGDGYDDQGELDMMDQVPF